MMVQDANLKPQDTHNVILARMLVAVHILAGASTAHAGETSVWEIKKGMTSASLASSIVVKKLYDTEYGRKWGLRASNAYPLPNGKMQILTFWRTSAISNLDNDAIYRCIDVIDTTSSATISATCSTPMLPD